jgi:hypothetical protein
MRAGAAAVVRSAAALSIVASALTATLAGQEGARVVRLSPFDGYGVLCAHSVAEPAGLTDGHVLHEVVYTGVVIAEDDRVAGDIRVVVRFERQPGHSRMRYDGRIVVEPTALAGRGEWEGGFSGELRGAAARGDVSTLASELLHRRTARVRRSAYAIPVAGPRPTRTVRRVLRGTGELVGLRLSFDHPANEGTPPPAAALPADCAGDFERWTGALLDFRGLARPTMPESAP